MDTPCDYRMPRNIKSIFRYIIMYIKLILCGYSKGNYLAFHRNDIMIALGYGEKLYDNYIWITKKVTNTDGSFTATECFVLNWSDRRFYIKTQVYRVKNSRIAFKLIQRNKSYDKLKFACENLANEYVIDTL